MQLGTRNGWRCLALLLAPSPSRDVLVHLGGVVKNRTTVRTVYLYLVTTVAIIMTLTGVIGSISDALNMYVFHLIGAESMASELGSLLGLLSSVVVGAPVWLYHLRIIERDRRASRQQARQQAESNVPDTNAGAISVPPSRDFVRSLYLYLVACIGLFILMFNSANLAPNAYRAFFMSSPVVAAPGKPEVPVPPDTYAMQSLVRDVIGCLVGLGVWLYHWHIAEHEFTDSRST